MSTRHDEGQGIQIKMRYVHQRGLLSYQGDLAELTGHLSRMHMTLLALIKTLKHLVI